MLANPLGGILKCALELSARFTCVRCPLTCSALFRRRTDEWRRWQSNVLKTSDDPDSSFSSDRHSLLLLLFFSSVCSIIDAHIMIADTLLIIFISITTALLGEGKFTGTALSFIDCGSSPLGLTWLLVYRTEKYQRLKGEVEKASKRRR